MKLRLILLSSLMLAPLALHAQEAAEDRPWAAKASLGYLATSGNTENSTLNTALEGSYSKGKWVHSARAFALNASENKLTTAEAYEFGWKFVDSVKLLQTRTDNTDAGYISARQRFMDYSNL